MYIKGLAHLKHSINAEVYHPNSESSPKQLYDLEQIDSPLCALVSPSVKRGGVSLRISRSLPSAPLSLPIVLCLRFFVAAPSEWFSW